MTADDYADDYAGYEDDYDYDADCGAVGTADAAAHHHDGSQPPEGYVADLRGVAEGSEVAARFSEDGCWYPAVVNVVIPTEPPHNREPRYHVTFTQYCNSETLPAEALRALAASVPPPPAPTPSPAPALAPPPAVLSERQRQQRERAMGVAPAPSTVAGEGAAGAVSPLFEALGGSAAPAVGQRRQASLAEAIVESHDWDPATVGLGGVGVGGGGVSTARRRELMAAFVEPSPDDRLLASERGAGRTIYKGGAKPRAGAEADAAKWEAELGTGPGAASSPAAAAGGDAPVSCPACGAPVMAEKINAHLDSGCAAHIVRVGVAGPSGRRPLVKKIASGGSVAGIRLASGVNTGVTAGVDLFKSGGGSAPHHPAHDGVCLTVICLCARPVLPRH
jgi:hypothetical protein